MTEATKTIDGCLSAENIRKGNSWQILNDREDNIKRVIVKFGRECKEWAPGMVYAEIHSLIEKNSGEEDPVVFTEGSV